MTDVPEVGDELWILFDQETGLNYIFRTAEDAKEGTFDYEWLHVVTVTGLVKASELKRAN